MKLSKRQPSTFLFFFLFFPFPLFSSNSVIDTCQYLIPSLTNTSAAGIEITSFRSVLFAFLVPFCQVLKLVLRKPQNEQRASKQFKAFLFFFFFKARQLSTFKFNNPTFQHSLSYSNSTFTFTFTFKLKLKPKLRIEIGFLSLLKCVCLVCIELGIESDNKLVRD